MEAKELRIGNLVYDNDNKLFHEVHTVSKDYIVLLFENSELEYDISEISPIQLTEEWLVKYGFEHKYGGLFYLDNISISVGIKHGKVFFCNSYVIVIHHIHQLQNLCYSLTGKELTIK